MPKKRTPVQRHQDALLNPVIMKSLKDQFSSGLKQGVYAVCKVVLEKATDPSKTDAERLSDIVAFANAFAPTMDDALSDRETDQ